MSISGLEATGVRADLQIEDRDALKTLATHHAEGTGLEWTFDFGGGAQSITVPLRWTKCNRSTGTVQVVRNVVMRDLIAEAEREDEPTSLQTTPTSGQVPAPPLHERPAAPSDLPSSTASTSHPIDVKRL